MSEMTTTVEYLSNIQPVKTDVILDDQQFLSHIHDPFALELLKKELNWRQHSYSLSKIQQKEMDAASGHCTFAFKDDYPWGTVVIDGRQTIVCKCLNKECGLFFKCRSGVSALSEEEKHILSEDSKSIRGGNKPENKNELTKEDDRVKIEKKNESNLSIDTVDYLNERNYSFSEVEYVSYFDKKKHVSSWKEAYIIICRALFEDYPKVFKSLRDTGEHSLVFTGYNSLWLKSPVKIGADYYVETKLDTTGYIRNIKCLLDYCHVKYEKISFSFNESYNNIVDKNESHNKTDIELSLNMYQREGSLFKAEITKNINPDSDTTVLTEILPEEDLKSESVAEVQEDTSKEIITEEESTVEEYNFTGTSFDKFVCVDQNIIIQCSVNERLVVNAGPGTGKTYTLIQKLITFLKNPEIDPEEIIILCFSRAAVEVIKSRLKEAYENGFVDMRWNLIDIRTFDSFATHMLACLQVEDPSMLPDNFSLEHLDYSGRISAAKDTIRKHPEIMEGCTHLIVDEVQDLVSDRAELVIAMIQALPETSGITLLGDACQSIYDYQVNDSSMDSNSFYRWMFNYLHVAKFFSLSINYRQTSDLEDITNNYREAILSNQKNKCQEASKEISNRIRTDERINLKKAKLDAFDEVFGKGSIGILTRSNGQALKISTWLRSNMVPHRIQRPLTDKNLNSWIAEIFCNYPSETVNKAEFVEYSCNVLNVSEEQSEDHWAALESTVSLTKDRYTIEELLNGIYTNARNPLLFTEENNTRITVSNIHRSKGREYEHVVLLDDGIYAEGKEKDLDEHKVSYVSVSRAKQNILKTNVGKHFIRSYKDGSRRSFETSARRGRKPALSRIEVGKVDDLSSEFFAESIDIQKQILSLQVNGQAVELRRNPSISNYIRYDLVMEDSEKVIGKTDNFFSRELIGILRTTLGLYGNAMPRFYPDALDEIYLDQKITLIGRWKPSLVGARRFGNLAIWEGVTMIGFAHPNYNRY